jgi:hypothetical protein
MRRRVLQPFERSERPFGGGCERGIASGISRGSHARQYLEIFL